MRFVRPINDTTPNVTNAFGSNHKGTDYGYPDATPIYASESGKVVFVKNDETRQWLANTSSDPFPHPRKLLTQDYGNFVKLDHGYSYETLYAHQKALSILVKEGDTVTKGQKIGEVGSTGNSTGNHLHWEIRKSGIVIDPAPLLDSDFTGYFAKVEAGDSQKLLDELRLERDRNWNLYQDQVKETEKSKLRITELEGQVSSLAKEKGEYQNTITTLNNKIALLNEAMAKDAREDADILDKLLITEEVVKDRDTTLQAIADVLHTTPDRNSLLRSLHDLTAPHEKDVDEFQKLYDYVFTELVKKRASSAKPFIKQLIERIKKWLGY
jgi:hypothetical protein